MNTKKSFPCAPVLTEEEIEWLEFGFEEWVDALDKIDSGWESNEQEIKTESRVSGICKGKVEMSDNFDKPLTFETLKKNYLLIMKQKKNMKLVL